MTTLWYQQFKDGRTELASVTPSEIDFSKPTLSATLTKVERSFKLNAKVVQYLVGVIPYAANVEYAAFDMKIHYVGGSMYLDLLYSDRPGSGTSATRGTWFDGWHLFYTRVNLGTNAVTPEVCLTKNWGRHVDETVKASINMYDSGRLSVVFQPAHKTGKEDTIFSTTSTDGVNWSSPATVVTKSAATGLLSTTYGDADLPSLTKSKGSWTTVSNSKTTNGAVLRNTRTKALQKGIVSFKVSATDIDLLTIADKEDCGRVRVYIDNVYHRTLNLATKGGYKYRVRLNSRPLPYAEHTVRLEHITGKYFYIDSVYAMNKSVVFSHCDSIIRHRTGLTPTATTSQEIITLYQVSSTNPNSVVNMYFVVDKSGNGTDFGSSRVKTFQFRTGLPLDGDKASKFHEDARGLWVVMEVPANEKYQTEYWLYSG